MGQALSDLCLLSLPTTLSEGSRTLLLQMRRLGPREMKLTCCSSHSYMGSQNRSPDGPSPEPVPSAAMPPASGDSPRHRSVGSAWPLPSAAYTPVSCWGHLCFPCHWVYCVLSSDNSLLTGFLHGLADATHSHLSETSSSLGFLNTTFSSDFRPTFLVLLP